MQDRTIDNALRQIMRAGGYQSALARQLLVLRGGKLPTRFHKEAMQRGGARRFVLMAMREGDQTCSQMADRLRVLKPSMPRKSAHNRCNGALLRLEDKGLVVREGRVWRTR